MGDSRWETSELVVETTFQDWTQGRRIASWGTNAGAKQLPFQSWRHFKESFAPELVQYAVSESSLEVRKCLDPFGGSGTTALTCQFLGIHPITFEVNPFLADLTRAKLDSYNADDLARDLGNIMRDAACVPGEIDSFVKHLPDTFVEPGVNGRWVFDREIAERIVAVRKAIDRLSSRIHRRLFRVLLGGVLIEVSNVIVNGKGRRYRRRWAERSRKPEYLDELFCTAAQTAIDEIHRFAARKVLMYEVRNEDCRIALGEPSECELAVFSPPYPNSFDYTDVYNVELWMLGYLSDRTSNRVLREATLSSHVQISREFQAPPDASPLLSQVLTELNSKRSTLWDHRIPDMIGGYFADMVDVLSQLRRWIVAGGSVWMVVGDSRYADSRIETGKIIAELAPPLDWEVTRMEPCRSMRASAQQGGRLELSESLIVLTRA